MTGGAGHNGGPPLDDAHVPDWEDGDPFVFFAWKAAHARAWKAVPWDIMLRRQDRAEAIGLTYEEYAREILERGRHLGSEDGVRIAAIKRARAPLRVAGDGRAGEAASLRGPARIPHRTRPGDPPRNPPEDRPTVAAGPARGPGHPLPRAPGLRHRPRLPARAGEDRRGPALRLKDRPDP